MTILLAIDTATENCSVALTNGQQYWHDQQEAPREHSQRLLGLVDQCLAEAQLSLRDIDGVVVGAGPGSFTGVRIGIAIAQGLAFSVGVPVLAVPTLTAMAYRAAQSHPNSDIIAAIDARMSEIYLARFQSDAAGQLIETLAPCVCAPTALADVSADSVAVGSAWPVYAAQLDPQRVTQQTEIRLPRALDMLQYAQLSWPRHSVEAIHLEPLYVRNEVTWKKLPGRG